MSESDESGSSGHEFGGLGDEAVDVFKNLVGLLNPETVQRMEILLKLATETRLLAEKAAHADTKMEYEKKLEAQRKAFETRLEVQRKSHEKTKADLDKQLSRVNASLQSTESARFELDKALTLERAEHGRTREAKRKLEDSLDQETNKRRAIETAKANVEIQLEDERTKRVAVEKAMLKLQKEHDDEKRLHGLTYRDKQKFENSFNAERDLHIATKREVQSLQTRIGDEEARNAPIRQSEANFRAERDEAKRNPTTLINSILADHGRGRFMSGYPEAKENGSIWLDDYHTLSMNGTVELAPVQMRSNGSRSEKSPALPPAPKAKKVKIQQPIWRLVLILDHLLLNYILEPHERNALGPRVAGALGLPIPSTVPSYRSP